MYFNLTDDATAHSRMTGVFVEKDGKQFLKLTNLDISPTVNGDTKIYVTGILPDPELSK